MKTKRRDGFGMRRILSAMITDRVVCNRIASQWPKEGGLFEAPWANLVGSWCIEHVRKYGEPPNGQLRTKYLEWAATTKAPEETVESVERFLLLSSEEHANEEEKPHPNFVLDMADRYFNGVLMKETMERAGELMEVGKVSEAEALLAGMKRIRLSSNTAVSVATDWDAWRRAFDDDQQRALIKYPGRLQDFLGRWLKRDTLIGLMAPDKTGKSVFLLDLAVRAVKGRNRVAYFDVGDNSFSQVMKRLGSRAARWPLSDNYSSEISVPLSVDREGEVELGTRGFDEPLTVSRAFKAFKRMSRGMDRLRLDTYGNGTASVATIAAALAEWEEQDGWTPEVVVIDYADILAPPLGVRDTLDQIDETWKQLRRLSQERNCLVVTATQASAEAYNDKATVLKKKHFSGRKTKLAHVNGMLGINVSVQDRAKGLARLNWIVRREGRYSETAQVLVAGAWAWYDPIVRVAE